MLPSGAAWISLAVRLNTLVVGAALISQLLSRLYSRGSRLQDERFSEISGDVPLVPFVEFGEMPLVDCPPLADAFLCLSPRPRPNPRARARIRRAIAVPRNRRSFLDFPVVVPDDFSPAGTFPSPCSSSSSFMTTT